MLLSDYKSVYNLWLNTPGMGLNDKDDFPSLKSLCTEPKRLLHLADSCQGGGFGEAMRGIKVIPPKQKYMALAEIHETFGRRGVVAYSCEVVGLAPVGGFVIAVADSADGDTSILKEYRRQMAHKHPDREPLFYIQVERADAGHLVVSYDVGDGEKRAAQSIEVKKPKALEAIERVPSEGLAQALKTILRSDDAKGE